MQLFKITYFEILILLSNKYIRQHHRQIKYDENPKIVLVSFSVKSYNCNLGSSSYIT